MPTNTEASLSGKGSEIMLPARGNPFAGQTDSATPDLSAEDVAAMFKTSLPSASAPAAAPAAEAEPVAFGMMDESPATFAAPADSTPTDTTITPSASKTEPAVVAETTTTVEVTPPSREATSGEAPADSTAVVAATTTVAVVSDQSRARQMVAGGAELTDEIGLGLPTYEAGTPLAATPQLTSLLVDKAQLLSLWQEVDAVQEELAKTPGISNKLADEVLKRLMKARNYLMNDRANFEEADLEVAKAKYLLGRVQRSRRSQHAGAILVYLLLFLAANVAGLLLIGNLSNIITAQGTALENFIWTILSGGFGGVTGALYGLWTHVARDQDYDPQFALWYYSNPLMGLLMGGVMYAVVRAGLLIATSGQLIEPSPYVLWVIAFGVGFKQNLAFSLLNAVLKRVIPQDERAKHNQEDETLASTSKPG